MTPTNGALDTPGMIASAQRSDGVRSGADEVGTGSLPYEFPQPPPPPPPPPTKARKAKAAVGGVLSRLPLRYQAFLFALLVIVVSMLSVRLFVPTVDEAQITADAAEIATAQVRNELDRAKAESTQIAVPTPFSWAKCPLSNEAKAMIGGEPSTGNKTPNIERATPLDEQAQILMQGFRLPDLRLVAITQSQLRVVADDPSAGVSLFTCSGDVSEPAPGVGS